MNRYFVQPTSGDSTRNRRHAALNPSPLSTPSPAGPIIDISRLRYPPMPRRAKIVAPRAVWYMRDGGAATKQLFAERFLDKLLFYFDFRLRDGFPRGAPSFS